GSGYPHHSGWSGLGDLLDHHVDGQLHHGCGHLHAFRRCVLFYCRRSGECGVARPTLDGKKGTPMRPVLAFAIGSSLALLAPGAARADTVYKSQVIAQAGDKAGDVALNASPEIQLAGLNDQEQLLFVATDAAGEDLLFQYAGGKLTPVVK